MRLFEGAQCLSSRALKVLWLLLTAGTILRLIVAFSTYGVGWDIDSYRIVGSQLDDRLLDVYTVANVEELFRWPYPPGYFPWIAVSVALASVTPLPFHGLIQLPMVVADGALAYLVQAYLGVRGASERARLAAAGLITLGPALAAVSGYHGQFDTLAMLPAVAALMVWERPAFAQRATLCGLLIGIGSTLKTFPVLMLLALYPTARSKREAAGLTAAALSLPAIALAPFALADPRGVSTLLRFLGVPGLGGLSLIVQPSLAQQWIAAGQPSHLNPANVWLVENGKWILAAGLVAAAVVVLARRPRATEATLVVFLAVLVFSSNFIPRYLVWILPLLIVAGYMRAAALAQLVVTPLLVISFLMPLGGTAVFYLYVSLALALWFGLAVGLVLVGTRLRAASHTPRWSRRTDELSPRPGRT